MSFVLTLAHYFYPQHTNNHKAKLLHPLSLVILSVLILIFQITLQVAPKIGVKSDTLGYAANISATEVIRLSNEKRSQAGVSSLSYNPHLAQAAAAKAAHMLAHDYWAHVAPDGTEPWKFFTDVGYKYRYAGENLARDFSNPQAVVDAWMASQSHKDNLLSSKYTEIGVAVAEGDMAGQEVTLVVQLFGNPLGGGTSAPVVAQARQVTTSTPSPTSRPKQTAAAIVTQPPSPTIVPTEIPQEVAVVLTPIPSQGQLSEIATLPPAENEASRFALLISPFETTRGVSILITGVLLLVVVIDGIVVARRRIPRLGGRTFAHMAFIGMILAMAIIAKAGKIL